MKREPYIIQKRNRNILQQYRLLAQTDIPRMKAYALIAEQYYLSEKRVRDILRMEMQKKTTFLEPDMHFCP